MFGVLISCIFSISLTYGSVITPIHSNPGIYFNPMGHMKITNEDLNILIPVDVSFILPHLQNINSAIGTCRFLCQQNEVLEDIECHNSLQPLQSRYQDVMRDNVAISHLISKRSKRAAWFAGVGTVFKHVFGTMDEDDAISYNSALQTLQNKSERLTSLIEDNILLAKSAISNFNETINTINTNEARLNDAVEKLSLNLKNLSIISDVFNVRLSINEIINTIETSLLTLSFKVDDILNAILFAKSNVLHPAILNPTQLYNELINSVNNLPRYREFPIKIELDSIHKIMIISELSCYSVDNKIIFVFKVPLVHHMKYYLYQNIPLPVPHDSQNPSSYAMIIPTTRYIAISEDKTSYCTLSQLDQCKQIGSQLFICSKLNEYSSVDTSSNCELEIITKSVVSLPKSCNSRFLTGKINIWERIKDDKWLYVQSENNKLSIECKTDLSEFSLSGTGILNLPDNCIAYFKNIRLLSKSSSKIYVNEVNSDFNIINDSCCNLDKYKSQLPSITYVNLTSLNIDSLSGIKHKTDDLITELKSLKNQPNITETLYYTYPTLSVISVLSIVLIVIYIMLKSKYCKLCRSPVTKPENLNNPENPESIEITELPSTSHPRLKVG
ncbi:uncharacterized protein LOC126378392 [Pectinophora gossypiella]|uniref:uncharacterized protein LOC126378392 n=1 Tax=Pectinophora gossypiella TaxID=13191 RepID=UPI00214F5703|nr:uncharacterized protein LOC126378392 [Pectinophora gossypiella]